jgi:hypothetical protein
VSFIGMALPSDKPQEKQADASLKLPTAAQVPQKMSSGECAKHACSTSKARLALHLLTAPNSPMHARHSPTAANDFGQSSSPKTAQ